MAPVNISNINNESMHLKIIPYDTDDVIDPIKYMFEWETVSFELDTLILKTNFSHPAYISSQITQDDIEIKFIN